MSEFSPDQPEAATPEGAEAPPVLYRRQGAVGRVQLNRPRYRNAQNSRMTYAIDAALRQAVDDPAVKVVLLEGAGPHFSAGHDIGTPERDADRSFARRHLWYDHVGLPGAEQQYVREQEVYLGMCRRWAGLPKPTVAAVQGACIAGGLMLAWVCDLIVASDDAFFADPVVHMGIPGVEYFAHAFELPARVAKDMLFTGRRLSAQEAAGFGMVRSVVPRAELEAEALTLAERIAGMPRLGLALAKQAVNHCEEVKGRRVAMDAVFGYHHFAHAHNATVAEDNLAGLDGRGMAALGRERG